MDLLASYQIFPTSGSIYLHPMIMDLKLAQWLQKNRVEYSCRLYPHIQKNDRPLLELLFSQGIYGDYVDLCVAYQYERIWVLEKMLRHWVESRI